MSRSFQNEDCSPNQLLSSLSAEDYARLVPHLRTVKLALGDVICQGSGNFGFAYFPTNSVVSLICDMEDGATVEVALTGNDGVLGTSIFLDGKATANRAIVGIAGEAVRMEARVLRDQFVRGGTFQRVLLRYIMTQEFIASMLGGRRETVTVAAGRLQDAGLIHYSRGRLRIVDRKRIEETVCECYQAVKTECNQVLTPNTEKYFNVCAKLRAELG